MVKLLTSSLALALTLVLASPASAVTPACFCNAWNIQGTISGDLACLELVDDTLDVCYGNDLVVRLVNNCAFEVVVSNIPELNGDGVYPLTAAPGEELSWQQPLEPNLEIGVEKTVTLTWNVEADGASHDLQLTFDGTCENISDTPGDEGCKASNATSYPWLLAIPLLGLLWRRRRAVTPQGT